MNKTVIITGVTGQMGSYFADFLLEKGLKVIGGVRRLSVPNKKNIEHINNENFILETMDLGDSHSIFNLIQKYEPDYFINCAANSFVGTSWDCPEQHFENNALGVLRELEAIRKYSQLTRYINFGSSEEMGDVLYSPQNELHPPRARSPYGASKSAARQIVKVYRDSYHLYALQCWCFNYESPRRGEEFVTRKITLGIGRINKAIKENEPFKPIVLGNLEAKRDWSDCRDFVEGVWRMINQEQYREDLQKFNITRDVKNSSFWSDKLKEYILSSNETHTVKEFIELAFRRAGIDGCWIGEGLKEKYVIADYLSDICLLKSHTLVEVSPLLFRPAEVSLLWGDSTLARQELGWKPKYSFEDLVNCMVDSDLSL